MTIKIEQQSCNGCGNSKEPPCMKVCPGDLIYKDFKQNKAVLRSRAECWSCAACVKVCPRQAIKLYYPPTLGGRGSFLTANFKAEKLTWQLNKFNKQNEKLTITIKNN